MIDGSMRAIKFLLLFDDEPYETEWSLEDLGACHHGGKITRQRQYTGLKDKNGKEIYEGDITQVKLNLANIINRYKIVFSDGMFTSQLFYSNRTNSLETHRHGLINAKVEVIGNCYENPELLKDDN